MMKIMERSSLPLLLHFGYSVDFNQLSSAVIFTNRVPKVTEPVIYTLKSRHPRIPHIPSSCDLAT